MHRVNLTEADIIETPGLNTAMTACQEDGDTHLVFRTDTVWYVVQYDENEPTRLWRVNVGDARVHWGPIDWSHAASRYYGRVGRERVWLPDNPRA